MYYLLETFIQINFILRLINVVICNTILFDLVDRIYIILSFVNTLCTTRRIIPHGQQI